MTVHAQIINTGKAILSQTLKELRTRKVTAQDKEDLKSIIQLLERKTESRNAQDTKEAKQLSAEVKQLLKELDSPSPEAKKQYLSLLEELAAKNRL